MRKFSPFIFIAGVALLLLGAFGDEFAIVVNKAVNICLECIGLG